MIRWCWAVFQRPSALVNVEAAYRFWKRYKISAAVYNVFDAEAELAGTLETLKRYPEAEALYDKLIAIRLRP
jgi:hypothetical protein